MPNTPTDSKYVVFRREVWEARSEKSGLSMLSGDIIDDAVVIRRQDVFAPPALDAYANMIQAAITIFTDTGGFIPGVDPEPPAIARLREIADYFHEQSELAYADSQRKIPD